MSVALDPTEWPRALQGFEPLPGQIKSDYTDFEVEELPLYEFSGEGTHTLFLLEKAGLTTMQAVHDVSKRLGVKRMDIGYAGLKDARAVTRQWMSVEHIDPARVQALEIPRINILDVTRHGNKLKLGHLRGNAFRIRVRETQPDRLAEVQDGLRRLEDGGVPNYFGRQRFGARGDSWQVGRAVLSGDIDQAIELILGTPGEMDLGPILKARNAFTAGNFEQSARLWPGMYRDERRALKSLARTPNRKKAFHAIDQNVRKFYVSAFQSYLFNQIVAQRVRAGTLGRLQVGDLAELHRNGAVFEVLDLEAEQQRADAFEISATGPLFGYRMTEPKGEPAQRETKLLTDEGLTLKRFATGGLRVKGARRAIRFQASDARIELGADDDGAYLELRFVLPKGRYATALLRELFEEHQPHPGGTRRG